VIGVAFEEVKMMLETYGDPGGTEGVTVALR